MGKTDIPELVELLIVELKKQGMGANICPAGLTDDQVKRIDGWTQDEGFTDKQMEGLKNFADAMSKAKRWIAIGFGIVAILALKDIWFWIINWIQEHFIR